MIEPGSEAPDFTLPDQEGNEVTLSDLRGRSVLLVFYPGDFSPTCTEQLNVYEEARGRIERRGASLLGISVDSGFCHRAFQRELGVAIPLLADFHPKGEVARAYGVYSDEYGTSARALVLIDPAGVVRWTHLAEPLEMPGTDLILEALGELQTA